MPRKRCSAPIGSQLDLPPFKTKPWAHQVEDLDASWHLPGAAIPWEPRCGKTKLAIDTAARLYAAGLIDAAVVVAPQGVHLEWTRTQIRTHWPLDDPLVVEWNSSQSRTKTAVAQREESLRKTPQRFVWVGCNVEAVATETLFDYLSDLVATHRTLLIVDESHCIKNPKAKRTKALMRLAVRCPYRRTLTGTPVGQGPLDLWSQYWIVDPNIFGRYLSTFKARYCVYERRQFGRNSFDELVGYKNLDELNAKIAPVTFPRRKADLFDLPERVFARRYFWMSEEQSRIYRELVAEQVARIRDDETVTAQHALTLLLRLQQVSRGHVATDTGEIVSIDGDRPSIDALLALVGEHRGKAIVWCRFTSDVAAVAAALAAEHGPESVVRCDGSVKAADRPALRDRFNLDPAVRFWVGTAATGGVGVDLPAATLMVNYSYGWDLIERTQALERNYGASQKASRVDVVDLVLADTPADERVLEALECKEGLASQVTGRTLKEMLT